jgi:hypothetical protein
LLKLFSIKSDRKILIESIILIFCLVIVKLKKKNTEWLLAPAPSY